MSNIEGLIVKYLIVVKREWLGRKEKKDHRIEVLKGKENVPEVPSKSTIQFDSESLSLTESQLKSGYVMAGNGQPQSKDEIEGIIAEFYHGDRLIHKLATPRSLTKQYSVDGPQN